MKKQIWRVTRDGKNFVGTGRFAGRPTPCGICCGSKVERVPMLDMVTGRASVVERPCKCTGTHSQDSGFLITESGNSRTDKMFRPWLRGLFKC